jgi:hypothetical protein
LTTGIIARDRVEADYLAKDILYMANVVKERHQM